MVDDRNSNKENLWSKILTEVQQHNIKTLPVRKNVVVLGNHGCGKTSLIAALQNAAEIKRGVGLEYHYLDVKDERLDMTSRLGFWVVDGDPYHSNLLKFALNEESFAHTMILLMVSVTEPWYLLDSLQQWIEVIEKHVQRLKLTPDDRERWKRSLVRHFQMYEEPTEEEGKTDGSESNITNKHKDTSSKPRHKMAYNPLHPEEEDVHDTNKEAAGGEKITLPLPQGVLEANLGIPIMVVVNKTDVMDTLERENDYRDEHFDFIQVHVRKLCLKYGAALVYTSVKDRKNCALLTRYLKHRIYGFPFQEGARIGEREAIFVPTGWDNLKKINILAESLFNGFCSASSAYNDVITRPTITLQSLRSGAASSVTGSGAAGVSTKQEVEIFVEDDQVFLMRQQAIMQRQQAAGQEQAGSPAGTPMGAGSPDGSMTPLGGGRHRDASNEPAPFGPRPGSGRAKGAAPGGGSTGAPGTGANDVVLVNFFNSLLNKRGGVMAGGPTSGSGRGLTRLDSTNKAQRERSVSPNANKDAANNGEDGMKTTANNQTSPVLTTD